MRVIQKDGIRKDRQHPYHTRKEGKQGDIISQITVNGLPHYFCRFETVSVTIEINPGKSESYSIPIITFDDLIIADASFPTASPRCSAELFVISDVI